MTEKEIKIRYLFCDSNKNPTWEFTYSHETAKQYAKIKGCYVKYQILDLIFDPLNI